MKKLMNILICTSAMVFCTYSSSIAADMSLRSTSETSTSSMMTGFTDSSLGRCLDHSKNLEQKLNSYEQRSPAHFSREAAAHVMPSNFGGNNIQQTLQFSAQNPTVVAIGGAILAYCIVKTVEVVVNTTKTVLGFFGIGGKKDLEDE